MQHLFASLTNRLVASLVKDPSVETALVSYFLFFKLKMVKIKIALYEYINYKGKFILSPQEQHQGSRFENSLKGPLPEIDMLI